MSVELCHFVMDADASSRLRRKLYAKVGAHVASALIARDFALYTVSFSFGRLRIDSVLVTSEAIWFLLYVISFAMIALLFQHFMIRTTRATSTRNFIASGCNRY